MVLFCLVTINCCCFLLRCFDSELMHEALHIFIIQVYVDVLVASGFNRSVVRDMSAVDM